MVVKKHKDPLAEDNAGSLPRAKMNKKKVMKCQSFAKFSMSLELLVAGFKRSGKDNCIL
jgi:hypothetical protein